MDLPSLTKTWHNASYPAISPTKPSLSVAGKTVLITGGGSGIGFATARAFAAAGAAQVVITGRTEEKLLAAKKDIQASYPEVNVCPALADVIDQKAVDAVFASLGKVDILVNIAGHLSAVATIADSGIDDWWSGFEINVKGAFIVTQAFLKAAAPNAILINVTTAIAQGPPMSHCSSYASSKLAQSKFFDCVQAENPDLHVVNVHPGIVLTDMVRKSLAAGASFSVFDDANLSAHFIVWLASPEARFLKGKVAWANWDVEELKAMEAEVKGSRMLTTTLEGISSVKHSFKSAE